MAPSTITKTILKAPECESNSDLVPRYRFDGSIFKIIKKIKSSDNKENCLRAWEKKMGFQTPLIWKNIIFISLIHIITLVWFGYDLMIGYYPKWQSIAFGKTIVYNYFYMETYSKLIFRVVIRIITWLWYGMVIRSNF